MQSDLKVACESARRAIVVPAIPLDAIRHEAQRRPVARTGLRRGSVMAASVASLALVAAAAAEMFGHVQISLQPSGEVHLAFDGLGGRLMHVKDPKESDIEKAARAMNFPVVLPKGLPAGTDAEAVTVLGPGAMQIAYNLPGAWRRSNHLLFVILANPRSVAPPDATPPKSTFSMQFGQKTGLGAVHWMVGQEEVIVLKSTITAAELAHFKAVMTGRAR